MEYLRTSLEEYLFHYTTVESLALILKNGTIRFKSLDKMDDLQEKETADVENIGQFCYISSWTDDITESIPMWNMYSSLDRGVRIRLKKNPFIMHDNLAIDLSKFLNMPIEDKTNGIPLQTIFPFIEMLSNQFYSPQAMSKTLLTNVEYTNNKEELYPRILSNDGNQFFIALGKLGKYKNFHWAFQNEWRYIFTALSLPFNQIFNGSFTDADVQAIADRLISGSGKQPFPYYDMIISNEAFSGMEVTLSPRISAGNRTIVEALMNAYNPSASISSSSLDGLI